jgi:hemoglobin-like flavoprotein
MTNVVDSALIEKSFDLAAQRSADITPLVYAKLFARHPETEAFFFRDTNGAVRGEMLYRVIEAIFDFVGPRNYAAHFFQCEVVTHEGYDVPRELFGTFFVAIVDALKELAGPDWTANMNESWDALLVELARFSAPSRETTTAG